MKNNIKFIRYGGLSPVKQTQYKPDKDPDKGFHNPPKKYGLYAMIKGYEDLFLLSSTSHPNHISGKSQWLKDDNGDLVEDTRKFDEKTCKEIYPNDIKKLLKKRKIKENQLSSSKKDGECPDDCDVESCSECDRGPSYLTVLKKPKTFTHTGDIWHHLVDTTDHCDVISRSGSWVKTTYNSFVKAFRKNKHLTLKELHASDDFPMDIKDIKIHDPYNGFGINYCKDHLEVFIEKIK